MKGWEGKSWVTMRLVASSELSLTSTSSPAAERLEGGVGVAGNELEDRVSSCRWLGVYGLQLVGSGTPVWSHRPHVRRSCSV